jgi:hypothetical protein
MLLKGVELCIVALAGDIIPDFIPTSICAFYELASKLGQSLRGLSKAKIVLNFLDTRDINTRALIFRK